MAKKATKKTAEEAPEQQEIPEEPQTTEQPVEDKAPEEESTDDSDFLVPTETYLKSGIHIGTKFKTKPMEPFIYKTRSDGLSVLNITRIDERIRQSINLLSQYEPEEIIVVSRRENGWKPVRLLSKLTGIRGYPGRYPPGILTNPELEDFVEAKIMLCVDVWPDRNAVDDARRVGLPVVALCDTNNMINNIDLVVPCNNKGRKSLGLYFYLLTRGYMLNKGLIQEPDQMSASMEDFLED